MSEDSDLNNLDKRIKKLTNDLDIKIEGQMREGMKRMDEYIKRTNENNRRYYRQRLNEELEQMERDIASGNTLSALNHKLNINMFIYLLD